VKKSWKSIAVKHLVFFKPFLLRNALGKYLPKGLLLQVSFKHILISLISFIGTSNCTVFLFWLSHRPSSCL
jgi:hypothetical protein